MKDVPRKAVVLAAGLGERMRPLSLDLPKPLMPFWGIPPLERVLRMLRTWGVEHALVNLHAGADAIVAWILAHPVDGLRVSMSFEPAILGTGGALVRAGWFPGPEPFWIANSDVIGSLDPAPLQTALAARHTLAAVWVHPERGPRTVDVANGIVRGFRSATPGAPGTATFCGVHLVRPEILGFLPKAEEFCTIVSAYEAAMRAGRRIAAVEIPRSFWADLGTPRQMIEAHREWQAPCRAVARTSGLAPRPPTFHPPSSLLPSPFIVRGFASIAPEASIGRAAVIEDSIVWPGARVAPGAQLHGAIVGRGALARGTVRGPLVRAVLALTSVERDALGSRLGADATAEAFEPRGSDRTFLRLRGARGGAVLIRYGRARPENERYAGHSRFLAALGIRVPAVLAENPAARFLAMEDLGDRTLADVIAGTPVHRMASAYATVARQTARWHIAGAAEARRVRLGLEEPFGPVLYDREHRLFLEPFLTGRLGASAALAAAAERDLKVVASWLTGVPHVLLHRDLQSSNVLWVRGRPAFIDFQGMRFGPAMYDLASLLCDPYVRVPAEVRAAAIDAYVAEAGARLARPGLFWPAAVQRLTQALGAYARLGAIRGAERFLRHIPPALALLAEAVRGCPAPLPALAAIASGDRYSRPSARLRLARGCQIRAPVVTRI